MHSAQFKSWKVLQMIRGVNVLFNMWNKTKVINEAGVKLGLSAFIMLEQSTYTRYSEYIKLVRLHNVLLNFTWHENA